MLQTLSCHPQNFLILSQPRRTKAVELRWRKSHHLRYNRGFPSLCDPPSGSLASFLRASRRKRCVGPGGAGHPALPLTHRNRP
ncbi:hypothetical protein CEP82_001870 [Mobiluncus mulieris]|nr:hypothetical protein CEP82_001870 [Mobiluncus mulieris]